MIGRILRDNRTLKEMFPGIILYGGVVQAVLVIFFSSKIFRAVGLWTGILCACAMAVHMAYCLETLVSLDEKRASAYVKKTMLLRYACICVILAAIALSGLGDPVSFVLGTLGLKAGAYLQPLTHRIAARFYAAPEEQQNSDSKEGEC